jgi:hypothetical protein
VTRGFYLPEYHSFSHIAQVPWPVDPRHYQRDWIVAIDILETWLEQRVGPHLTEWAFSSQQDQEYWQACIAFRQERMKTLFLLAWG